MGNAWLSPKSLCKIMSRIPTGSFISSMVCLRAQNVSDSYEALLITMTTDLCGHWSRQECPIICSFPSCNWDFPADASSIPRVLFCFKDQAPAGMPAFMYLWIVGSKIEYVSNKHNKYRWGKRLFLSVDYVLLKIKDILKDCWKCQMPVSLILILDNCSVSIYSCH